MLASAPPRESLVGITLTDTSSLAPRCPWRCVIPASGALYSQPFLLQSGRVRLGFGGAAPGPCRRRPRPARWRAVAGSAAVRWTAPGSGAGSPPRELENSRRRAGNPTAGQREPLTSWVSNRMPGRKPHGKLLGPPPAPPRHLRAPGRTAGYGKIPPPPGGRPPLARPPLWQPPWRSPQARMCRMGTPPSSAMVLPAMVSA